MRTLMDELGGLTAEQLQLLIMHVCVEKEGTKDLILPVIHKWKQHGETPDHLPEQEQDPPKNGVHLKRKDEVQEPSIQPKSKRQRVHRPKGEKRYICKNCKMYFTLDQDLTCHHHKASVRPRSYGKATKLGMASAFARTFPSSLSSRTLFVKCSPAPANFTERRAVLKALATAGNSTGIEVFKKLEDNSSFIAVTADPACAKALVNESPYQRILHVQDSATAATFSTAAWGAAFRTTITDPVNIQPLTEWPEKSNSAKSTVQRDNLGLNSKIFTIHVFPANAAYNHKHTISLNPLHGPWPENSGYSSFVSTALRRTVPRGYMSPGLRDWETGHQLSERPAGHEDEGAESLLGATKRRAYFYKERRRKAEAQVPDVMRSLAAVAKSAANSPHQLEASKTAKGLNTVSRSEEIPGNEIRKTSGFHRMLKSPVLRSTASSATTDLTQRFLNKSPGKSAASSQEVANEIENEAWDRGHTRFRPKEEPISSSHFHSLFDSSTSKELNINATAKPTLELSEKPNTTDNAI